MTLVRNIYVDVEVFKNRLCGKWLSLFRKKYEARDSSTPLSEFVVMKLVEPYTMKGRTITMDNFFTSVPLALKLLSKKIL